MVRNHPDFGFANQTCLCFASQPIKFVFSIVVTNDVNFLKKLLPSVKDPSHFNFKAVHEYFETVLMFLLLPIRYEFIQESTHFVVPCLPLFSSDLL